MISRRFASLITRPIARQSLRTLTSRSITPSSSTKQLLFKNAAPMQSAQIITAHRGLRLEPETMEEIEQRVNTVLLCYDKIDPKALTMESHFINDLGLDSLDHVEVIVAMENEFMVEINDNDQESLMSPREICEYLADMWDVSE